MTVRSPFDGLRMSPEIACEFFAVFSRFEFALKDMGLLIQGRPRAEPDWHGFADQASQWLVVEPGSALEMAITYLGTEPPFVQTRDRGWQPMGLRGATPIARAIDAGCRVRHNLFHGGKHTPHSPAGRDQRLVESALAVLTACLEQDAALRASFEQLEP